MNMYLSTIELLACLGVPVLFLLVAGGLLYRRGSALVPPPASMRDRKMRPAREAPLERNETVRVLVTYKADKTTSKRALRLADELRARGIDGWIDQYVNNPVNDWPRWMFDEIEKADYVLIVCTPEYKACFEGTDGDERGQGVAFEGRIITNTIYRQRANTKFVPVIFDETHRNALPQIIDHQTPRLLPDELDQLVNLLNRKPATEPGPILQPTSVPSRGSAGSNPIKCTSRAEAHFKVSRLLAENRAIHEQCGPDSPARADPESELVGVWQRKVVEQIIPNNKKILEVLDDSRDLLRPEELRTLEVFRQHASDLERGHIHMDDSLLAGRFPEEMNQILELDDE